MSIIAKKLTTASVISDSYEALGPQLSSVHIGLLNEVQPFTDVDLRIAKPSVASGRIKAFLNEKNSHAPCFSIGTGEHERLAFAQFSSPLTQLISGAKLGSAQSDEPAAFAPAGLLDIILLQPFVGEILQGLAARLGLEDALQQTGRFVSMVSVPRFDENENWIVLSLPFALKEGGKKDIGLSVDLFLSSKLADTLVQAAQSASNDLVIDPADPWAAHMHDTVMQSALPVKVILEVLSLSVADCTRLKLGQTIALPGASHKQLNVNAEVGSNTVTLATSTLGVCKSSKAVKLLDDIDPDFLSDIGSVMVG